MGGDPIEECQPVAASEATPLPDEVTAPNAATPSAGWFNTLTGMLQGSGGRRKVVVLPKVGSKEWDAPWELLQKHIKQGGELTTATKYAQVLRALRSRSPRAGFTCSMRFAKVIEQQGWHKEALRDVILDLRGSFPKDLVSQALSMLPLAEAVAGYPDVGLDHVGGVLRKATKKKMLKDLRAVLMELQDAELQVQLVEKVACTRSYFSVTSSPHGASLAEWLDAIHESIPATRYADCLPRSASLKQVVTVLRELTIANFTAVLHDTVAREALSCVAPKLREKINAVKKVLGVWEQKSCVLGKLLDDMHWDLPKEESAVIFAKAKEWPVEDLSCPSKLLPTTHKLVMAVHDLEKWLHQGGADVEVLTCVRRAKAREVIPFEDVGGLQAYATEQMAVHLRGGARVVDVQAVLKVGCGDLVGTALHRAMHVVALLRDMSEWGARYHSLPVVERLRLVDVASLTIDEGQALGEEMAEHLGKNWRWDTAALLLRLLHPNVLELLQLLAPHKDTMFVLPSMCAAHQDVCDVVHHFTALTNMVVRAELLTAGDPASTYRKLTEVAILEQHLRTVRMLSDNVVAKLLEIVREYFAGDKQELIKAKARKIESWISKGALSVDVTLQTLKDLQWEVLQAMVLEVDGRKQGVDTFLADITLLEMHRPAWAAVRLTIEQLRSCVEQLCIISRERIALDREALCSGIQQRSARKGLMNVRMAPLPLQSIDASVISNLRKLLNTTIAAREERRAELKEAVREYPKLGVFSRATLGILAQPFFEGLRGISFDATAVLAASMGIHELGVDRAASLYEEQLADQHSKRTCDPWGAINRILCSPSVGLGEARHGAHAPTVLVTEDAGWPSALLDLYSGRCPTCYEVALCTSSVDRFLEDAAAVYTRAESGYAPDGLLPTFAIVLPALEDSDSYKVRRWVESLPGTGCDLRCRLFFIVPVGSPLVGVLQRKGREGTIKAGSEALRNEGVHAVRGPPQCGKTHHIYGEIFKTTPSDRAVGTIYFDTNTAAGLITQLEDFAARGTKFAFLHLIVSEELEPTALTLLFSIVYFGTVFGDTGRCFLFRKRPVIALEMADGVHPSLARLPTTRVAEKGGAQAGTERAVLKYLESKRPAAVNMAYYTGVAEYTAEKVAEPQSRYSLSKSKFKEGENDQVTSGSSFQYLLMPSLVAPCTAYVVVGAPPSSCKRISCLSTMQSEVPVLYLRREDGTAVDDEEMLRHLQLLFGRVHTTGMKLTPILFMALVKQQLLLQARRSAVLVGDAGAGKTLLQRTLAELAGWPLHCMDVTTGTRVEHITAFLREELARIEGNSVHVFFFDEINTSAAQASIKALLYDRHWAHDCAVDTRLRQLGERVLFAGAANPYLVRCGRKVFAVQEAVHPTMEETAWCFDRPQEHEVVACVVHMCRDLSAEARTRLGSVLPKIHTFYSQKHLPCSLRDVARCARSVAEVERVLTSCGVRDVAVHEVVLYLLYVLPLTASEQEAMRHELEGGFAAMREAWQTTEDKLISCFTEFYHFEEGVVLHASLRELLVATFICIYSGIHLLVVGPPGTSKSFALTLLCKVCTTAAFQATSLPPLSPCFFQCSRLVTEERIAQTLQASSANVAGCIPLVAFDELATASAAPGNPLRCLNKYLDSPSTCVCVATSNFEVDRSLMSRFHIVTRHAAFSRDLLTLLRDKELSDTRTDKLVAFFTNQGQILDQLRTAATHVSDVLMRVGNRDVYALLASLSLAGRDVVAGLGSQRYDLILRHSFGCGLPQFANDSGTHPVLEGQHRDPYADERMLIRSCAGLRAGGLDDGGSGIARKRPMHIQAMSFAAVHGLLRELDGAELVTGSVLTHTPDMQREQLLQLKGAMERGATTFIFAADYLRESILDVANGMYTQTGGMQTVRVSIGSASEMWLVDPSFKCIFVDFPDSRPLSPDGSQMSLAAFYDRFERRMLCPQRVPLDDTARRLRIICEGTFPEDLAEFLSDTLAVQGRSIISGYHDLLCGVVSASELLALVNCTALAKLALAKGLPCTKVEELVVKVIEEQRLHCHAGHHCVLTPTLQHFALDKLAVHLGLDSGVFSGVPLRVGHDTPDTVLCNMFEEHGVSGGPLVVLYQTRGSTQQCRGGYQLFALCHLLHRSCPGRQVIVVAELTEHDAYSQELCPHAQYRYSFCEFGSMPEAADTLPRRWARKVFPNKETENFSFAVFERAMRLEGSSCLPWLKQQYNVGRRSADEAAQLFCSLLQSHSARTALKLVQGSEAEHCMEALFLAMHPSNVLWVENIHRTSEHLKQWEKSLVSLGMDDLALHPSFLDKTCRWEALQAAYQSGDTKRKLLALQLWHRVYLKAPPAAIDATVAQRARVWAFSGKYLENDPPPMCCDLTPRCKASVHILHEEISWEHGASERAFSVQALVVMWQWAFAHCSPESARKRVERLRAGGEVESALRGVPKDQLHVLKLLLGDAKGTGLQGIEELVTLAEPASEARSRLLLLVPQYNYLILYLCSWQKSGFVGVVTARAAEAMLVQKLPKQLRKRLGAFPEGDTVIARVRSLGDEVVAHAVRYNAFVECAWNVMRASGGERVPVLTIEDSGLPEPAFIAKMATKAQTFSDLQGIGKVLCCGVQLLDVECLQFELAQSVDEGLLPRVAKAYLPADRPLQEEIPTEILRRIPDRVLLKLCWADADLSHMLSQLKGSADCHLAVWYEQMYGVSEVGLPSELTLRHGFALLRHAAEFARRGARREGAALDMFREHWLVFNSMPVPAEDFLVSLWEYGAWNEPADGVTLYPCDALVALELVADPVLMQTRPSGSLLPKSLVLSLLDAIRCADEEDGSLYARTAVLCSQTGDVATAFEKALDCMSVGSVTQECGACYRDVLHAAQFCPHSLTYCRCCAVKQLEQENIRGAGLGNLSTSVVCAECRQHTTQVASSLQEAAAKKVIPPALVSNILAASTCSEDLKLFVCGNTEHPAVRIAWPQEGTRVNCFECMEDKCVECGDLYHINVDCRQMEHSRWECEEVLESVSADRGQHDAQRLQDELRSIQVTKDNYIRDEMLKLQSCKHCPRCGRVVLKLDGCDHMVCGRDAHDDNNQYGSRQNGCGGTFSWSTAPPYRADTTGACYNNTIARLQNELQGVTAAEDQPQAIVCAVCNKAGPRGPCLLCLCCGFVVCAQCTKGGHAKPHVMDGRHVYMRREPAGCDPVESELGIGGG